MELEHQVELLVERGYPELAGLEPAAFRDRLSPLEKVSEPDAVGPGRIPFVLVVASRLVPAARAVERILRNGETGFSVLDDDDLARFAPIDAVDLPDAPAYLLVDVDTGAETRNVTPDSALESILERGRSPLTVDEGIALVTHHPEAVAPNAGFSLLASRCGDRRVTAIWISKGRPKLGWCWAGNPHTWLGSASCAARLAPASDHLDARREQ